MIEINKALNSADCIVVDARLSLLPTDKGGRGGKIFSGYRPNHRFDLSEKGQANFFIGEIQFANKNEIFPGEIEAVTIIFLRAGRIEQYMVPGQKWLIQEGSRVVGEGEILSVRKSSSHNIE